MFEKILNILIYGGVLGVSSITLRKKGFIVFIATKKNIRDTT